MAALLISITLMSVFLTMAMPVWRQANQREKEAELLFRLGQYVRAIELYKKRYANTNPPSVDVLVQQKYLRKKYRDPITGGDFKLLSPQDMQTAAAPVPGPRLPGREATTSLREAQQPVAGVASRSTATSIRIYKNRQQYNQWIVTPEDVFLANRQSPQPGQPGQPGAPGRPGQPGPRQPGQGSPFTPGTGPGQGIPPGGQRPPGR